ncbi:MAG: MDR family MFS transporter [Aeromonas sp.]
MQWRSVKQFSPLVWIVIGGTFMVRTSYYMVWPFLSILLYQQYGLSASMIGSLLGGSMALSTLVSFYGGWLSDRCGRRSILLCGCLVAMGSFGLLGGAHSIYWLGVGVMGSGLSSGLIDAPGKALMADSLAEPKARELALHLRYFLLNVGAALGPLLGVTLGINAQQETFLCLVASYLLLALGFCWGFWRAGHLTCHLADHQARAGATPCGLRGAMKVLLADRAFLLLVMANVLMVLVYSQFQSPLVQYLTRAGAPQVTELIGWLVATNALTVVVLQFPLLRLLSRWPVRVRLHIGMALFLAAQLLFAWANPMVRSHWFAAVLLLSLGEAILFPLLNVLIDKLAPAHLKGSYFGASALAGLGGAAGALLGGWIIEQWSGPLLFVLMALLCVLTFGFYEAGVRQSEQRRDRQQAH